MFADTPPCRYVFADLPAVFAIAADFGLSAMIVIFA